MNAPKPATVAVSTAVVSSPTAPPAELVAIVEKQRQTLTRITQLSASKIDVEINRLAVSALLDTGALLARLDPTATKPAPPALGTPLATEKKE